MNHLPMRAFGQLPVDQDELEPRNAIPAPPASSHEEVSPGAPPVPKHFKETVGPVKGEKYPMNGFHLAPDWKPIGLAGDAAARKAAPIASGLLHYFPNACAAVAHLSKVGNDQHNPGQPLGWSFTKSTDEADCVARHLAQAGTVDTDGVRHSAKVAWRALALLERELLAAHPELVPGKNVRDFKR